MQKNSVNKVILVGRLGQKPELKYTPEQMAVVNITIATTESRKRGDEYKDETEWHNITLFGSMAEFVANYLDKGSLVYVEGRLTTQSWEKDGVTKYMTKIFANTITSLGSKPKSDNSPFDPNDDPGF